MKRCPDCHRFGIEMHPIGHEVCPWEHCPWVNKKDIDLDKVEHPFKFQNFANAIKKKTAL